MKYCYKCGNRLEEYMLYCPKCGTKVEVDVVRDIDLSENYVPKHSESRKGMKIAMAVCIALAVFYAIAGVLVKKPNAAVELIVGFTVLAVMFHVLAKSPKDNPFVLGKESGLRKSALVVICVALFLAACCIGSMTVRNPNVSEKTVSVTETDTSLDDVQNWYEEQIPVIEQDLSQYAKSVKKVSDIEVSQSHFYFGGGWNDCYYYVEFTCKVDGTAHNGEARAFLKYKGDDVEWFSFEIFGSDGGRSVIKVYDNSYDKIIEEYYRELESKYT